MVVSGGLANQQTGFTYRSALAQDTGVAGRLVDASEKCPSSTAIGAGPAERRSDPIVNRRHGKRCPN